MTGWFAYCKQRSNIKMLDVCLGEQLRDLLKKHGSFKALELCIKKTHLKKKKLAQHGGYYTKAYLMANCAWTR